MKIKDFYKEEVIFTQINVNKFAEITEGFNPIQWNEDYSKNTIFQKPILNGI